MKNIKILFAVVCVLFATAAIAQQDFSGPQYAKWGNTPEERQANILNSNFLKESCDNRDYNAAAGYLKSLVESCPEASSTIYARGALVYKNKINRAKSVAEKNVYIDSMLLMYDLRAKYFGDDAKQGLPYILDRKAREVLTYRPNDREAVRKAFGEAINAGGNEVAPELVVIYFKNLCDDYKTDVVFADELIAEYDRLTPLFENNPDAGDFKNQFDACFGMSGAASCENLETLFRKKLEAAPEDKDVLAQAVGLMSRAKCESDYYYMLAEKYYEVAPSSEAALFLAQGFQNKGEFAKAIKYLNEALATEAVPAEREKLLVRISLVQLVANDISAAAAAARQARDINPTNGLAYFVLGQCYANSAGNCAGFNGQAAYWAAYDTMAQAVSLLENDPDYLNAARSSLAAYRNRFPTSEECFFNELSEGQRYTVNCGLASGVSTTVRFR